MKPLILINFKLYPEAMGEKVLKLVKELENVKSKKYEIALAPSLLSLARVKTKIPLFAQHACPVPLGAHTGSISPEELKLMKAKGVILNHSEKKIPFSELESTFGLCRKAKLQIVVCASTLAEIKEIAALHPDYLAYEPSELIGGNLSVTEAQPGIITQAVKLVKKISPKTKVLCGAGIHNKDDLIHALKLGAEGVLLAHAVVKAKNPQKFLREMIC